MSLAKSAAIQNLDLKDVYDLPVIYDRVLEVSYPDAVYTMKSVYDHPPTNVKVTRFSGTGGGQEPSGGSPAPIGSKVDLSSGDRTAMSVQILAKQEALLAKLKSLRNEVDAVERSLQPEAKTTQAHIPEAVKQQKNVPQTLNERLKEATLSGSTETVKRLILEKEESLLARLKNLHQNLDNLEKSAQSGKKMVARVPRKNLPPRANKEELVVTADPRYPPLSLIAAGNFLADYGRVFTKTYIHSSLPQVPESLRHFLDVVSDTDGRGEADFILTLIWKEVGVDTSLMVDPSRQNGILAEANIVRYIVRLLNSNYDTVENVELLKTNDKWLNLATRCIVYGNAKERQSAVRQLNGHLGKWPFLTGGSVSLVDAVLVSALYNAKEVPHLTGNLKKWLHACVNSELFNGMRELLSV